MLDLGSLKLKAKQSLPLSIRSRLSGLKPGNNSPYNGALAQWDQGLSDYFVYRGGDYSTVFVAENTAAIMNARHLPCVHYLYFFGSDGRRIHEITHESDRFNAVIECDLPNDIEVAGFIHQTVEASAAGKELTRQHRGYTGYRRKSATDAPFAMVHGNFGSLYYNRKIASHAVQRSEFVYSSQLLYDPLYRYELMFLNPTPRRLELAIGASSEDGNRIIHEVSIDAFGHAVFESGGDAGQLFWKSKLPICRPIVFEHDDAGKTFDVFHG